MSDLPRSPRVVSGRTGNTSSRFNSSLALGIEGVVPMLPASGGSQGASVAVLSGELDLNSVQAVQTLTDPAVLSPGATLVLDLSAVTFMDSYGINAIVGAHFRVAAAQGQLVLRSPSPAVRAVLRLTDVDAFIPIEPSSTAVTELGRKPVNGW